jgi:hypothetical protein
VDEEYWTKQFQAQKQLKDASDEVVRPIREAREWMEKHGPSATVARIVDPDARARAYRKVFGVDPPEGQPEPAGKTPPTKQPEPAEKTLATAPPVTPEVAEPPTPQARKRRRKPKGRPRLTGAIIETKKIIWHCNTDGLSHLDTCKRLDRLNAPRPQGAIWYDAKSWEAAYRDDRHNGRVKTWLAKARKEQG